MAKRFKSAGFTEADMTVVGPNDRKGNLVVRLRGKPGSKLKPILIIAHTDVVEAKREDWTTDPFKFVEKDGYFYGRGAQDMKGSDAIAVADLIRLKKEGFVPARDIILALTADEEGGKSNGVDWLLKKRRELVDAEYVLNPDSGQVHTDKPLSIEFEATEKLYADYQLMATNAGGHSSLPVADNAIYHVANALTTLQHYTFPTEINAVTRGYFEAMAKIESGQTAADMRAVLQNPPDAKAAERLSKDVHNNATLRTTCIATMLAGGHAVNALPQRATANVNCRIFPGHSGEEIRQQLVKLFNDPALSVRYQSDAGVVSDTASDRKAMAVPPLRDDDGSYGYEDRPDRRRQKKNNHTSTVLLVIAGVLVLISVIFIAKALTGNKANNDAVVPNFVNSTLSDAQAKAANVDLTLVQGAEQYCDTVPKGSVGKQTPAANAAVPSNKTVTVNVCKGEAPVKVPDVTTDTYDAAQQALVNAGFEVKRAEQTSTTAEAETVLKQDPTAGTEEPKGTTITLTVAVAPKTVTPEDVSGKSFDDAVNALHTQGFINVVRATQDEQSDSVAAGDVISQDPPASGGELTLDTKITLTVSAGPPPPPSAQQTMPAWQGQRLGDVRNELNAMNLSLQIKVSGDNDDNSLILNSDVAQGATLNEGQTITLTTMNIGGGNGGN